MTSTSHTGTRPSALQPFHVAVETVFHDGSRGQPFRALAREADGSPLLLTAEGPLALAEGDEVVGEGILQMPDRDRIPETLVLGPPGRVQVLRPRAPAERNPVLRWAERTFDGIAQSGSLTVLQPERIDIPLPLPDTGRRHLRDLLEAVGTRDVMGRMVGAVRRQLEDQLPLGFRAVATADMAGQILLSSGKALPLTLRETPHEHGKHVVIVPYAPFRTGSTEFQDKTGLPIQVFQLKRPVPAEHRHLRSLAHEAAHAVQDQYGFAYPERGDSAANRAVKNRSEGFADAFAVLALVQQGALPAAQQLAAWRETSLIAMPAALCTGRVCRAALDMAQRLQREGALAGASGEDLLRHAAAVVRSAALEPAELQALDGMRERIFADAGIALDHKGRVPPAQAVAALAVFRTQAAAALSLPSLKPLLAAADAALRDQAHPPALTPGDVSPAMRRDYLADLQDSAAWLRRWGLPGGEQTLLLRETVANVQIDGRRFDAVTELAPLAMARIRQLHRIDGRMAPRAPAEAVLEGRDFHGRALRISGLRPRYPALSAALALPPAARLNRLRDLLGILHDGGHVGARTVAEPILRRAARECLQTAYAVRLDSDSWALARMRLSPAACALVEDLMEDDRATREDRLRQEAGGLGKLLRQWPKLHGAMPAWRHGNGKRLVLH